MKKVVYGLLWFCLLTNVGYADSALIAQAVSGPQRSTANKARDIYRHPRRTLEFFAVDSTMSVVEIWPGDGWYTEILAPLLKDQGTLYTAHFAADAALPFFRNKRQYFVEKTSKKPEVYGKIILTELQPPGKLQLAPDASVDRVLTFRNVHNWMKSGHAEVVFQAMYKALKPGGILGVVEHRHAPGKQQDPRALSGYVTEDYVIALANQAGFQLVERSEINANQKDSGEHPKGVWTLPPTLRLKARDRDKYLTIGESDRMTLKFIKPRSVDAKDFYEENGRVKSPFDH